MEQDRRGDQDQHISNQDCRQMRAEKAHPHCIDAGRQRAVGVGQIPVEDSAAVHLPGDVKLMAEIAGDIASLSPYPGAKTRPPGRQKRRGGDSKPPRLK